MSNEKDKNMNENDIIDGSNDGYDGDGAPPQNKTKFEKCKVEIKLKKKDLKSHNYKMNSLKTELKRLCLDGKSKEKRYFRAKSGNSHSRLSHEQS